jgi:hypothetical protein
MFVRGELWVRRVGVTGVESQARHERVLVRQSGIKDPFARRCARNHRRPRDVKTPVTINRQCRPIVRARVQLPPIFADTNRRSE